MEYFPKNAEVTGPADFAAPELAQEPGLLFFEDGPIQETPPVLGHQSYGKEDHFRTGYKKARGSIFHQPTQTDEQQPLS